MFRKACSIALIGLIVASASPSADEGRSQAPSSPSSSSRSSGKRVAWTIIGAAAGFGAGVFLGLNAFDDAINSDRKVWTTAIVGAAAGGFAGAFLSRDVGRTPRTAVTPALGTRDALGEIDWQSAVRRNAPIEPPTFARRSLPLAAAVGKPLRGAGLRSEHAHDR